MPTEWNEIMRLQFGGPRYSGHALDIVALQEIIRAQQLVRVVARGLFLQQNPGRRRVPQGFDQRFDIRIRQIVEGSALVPMEVQKVDDGSFWDDDLPCRSGALIHAAIQSQDQEGPLPRDLPRAAVPLLCELGERVDRRNWIGVIVEGQEITRLTGTKRVRLLNYISEDYEDFVDLEGEIRSADLDGRRFTMRLSDSAKVEGTFSEDQEEQVIDALKQHKSARLRIEGYALFEGGTDRLKEIRSIEALRFQRLFREPLDRECPRIWDNASEIAESIDDAEFGDLPLDASSRIDDLLYGGDESSE